MRVNIDTKAQSDPRFPKLGQRLIPPTNRYEALGRCISVWMHNYEIRSPLLSAEDVDALAELPGFATAMVGAGLARVQGPVLWICGVQERIGWLLVQDHKRGLALAAKRASVGLPPQDVPRGIPVDVPRDVPGDVPISLDLDSALDRDRDRDHVPPAAPPAGASSPSSRASGSKKPKTKGRARPEPTAEQIADVRGILDVLGKRNGVTYSAGKADTELIVDRLNEGRTALELAMIATYCADPKPAGGLGWEDDPQFKSYLRPATLFGPETHSKYLDPAVAHCRRRYGDDDLTPRPETRFDLPNLNGQRRIPPLAAIRRLNTGNFFADEAMRLERRDAKAAAEAAGVEYVDPHPHFVDPHPHSDEIGGGR